jgi:spermidine/putrescine transport system substrate-binding protein
MKILAAFLTLLCITICNAKQELNIYVWSNFIPNKVIKIFTKETGIKVNITEFDNNETLFAKLKTTKHSGYDVVVPSNYFISRMVKQKVLQPLDKTKLPNIKNLNPSLLNRKYDPKNIYTIPYVWTSTGIVINANYFDKLTIQKWTDLWNPKYKNQLMILDDIREVFAIAFLALGYSVNETNPKHIEEAYHLLQKLLPNIKIFTADGEQTIYIDEDATIGMIWGGDYLLATEENPQLRFLLPKDGWVISIDNFAIPINAPNIANAHTFINFIMRPDISLKIMEEIKYTVPNSAALRVAPPTIQQNSIINPQPSILKHSHLLDDVGDAIKYYEKYWELLKIES